jgi:tRNA (guanine-N7-)-methyltransferase
VIAARSAEYRARVASRREALGRQLRALLVGDTGFVWEVGAGHGHFLTAYAAAHKEVTCIGIDIVADRVARAQRKRNRARLERLHFLLAEADDFLACLPETARFSEVYVLFPDPWPKRRHHKNRVMKPSFLEAVAARVGKGGALYFRTDHEPYFREVAASLKGHASWRAEQTDALPFEEPTVFEKRAERHFTLVARRR